MASTPAPPGGDAKPRGRGRPRSSKTPITGSPLHGLSPSVGGSTHIANSSPLGSGSPSGDHPGLRTTAELAREKKLREDPLADVHGPLYVSCRRCGNRIKLSPKSTYDPFHWQKHRERCLKKPVGIVKRAREAKDSVSYKSNAKPSSSSSSITPPLTSDDYFTDSPTRIKEESPSPPPQPARVVLMRPPDLAFEDYLFRSRRKPPARDLSPVTAEAWQSWSWDQLRPPVWVVATYHDPDPGEDAVGIEEPSHISISALSDKNGKGAAATRTAISPNLPVQT